MRAAHWLAEGVGFEPTEACTSAVFKTAAFDHSAIPPFFAPVSEARRRARKRDKGRTAMGNISVRRTLQSQSPNVQYRSRRGEVLEWSIRTAC